MHFPAEKSFPSKKCVTLLLTDAKELVAMAYAGFFSRPALVTGAEVVI